jgi:hypothetical protein
MGACTAHITSRAKTLPGRWSAGLSLRARKTLIHLRFYALTSVQLPTTGLVLTFHAHVCGHLRPPAS